MDRNTGPNQDAAEITSKFSKQRQFPRYSVDLKVELHRIGESRPRLGHSTELSESGLGGVMVADMPIGEVVTVVFEGAPLLRPIRVQAVVRRREGYSYGLEFLSLSQEQRAIIHTAGLLLPRVA